MFNINKNHLIQDMSELLQLDSTKKIDYLPDGFKKKQEKSLEIFKKRILLEEVIEKTITFNKNLEWDTSTKNLSLTTTAEDLIEVFKLRSTIYTEINYQKECPDVIEGLNFDKFDTTSAIIMYKQNKEVTGTCRLIFDSKNKLPTEEKVSFEQQRKQFNKIGEISRNIVKYRNQGLNLEFKYLMRGIYYLTTLNNVDLTLFGIKKDDLKLFSKLGKIEVIKELDSYGEVKKPFLIISRESMTTSNFFKKMFL